MLTRVETYHLEPICLDTGDKLALLRSFHDIFSTLPGGEWHHHKMLETKQNKTKSAPGVKVMATNL